MSKVNFKLVVTWLVGVWGWNNLWERFRLCCSLSSSAPANRSLALRVDTDFDYCILNCSAASLPERWLSSVSLGLMRVEAKRAFVLADWMKSATRCEGEQEFLLLLQTEQIRARNLSEGEMDQIIKRDESRLERFETLTWELRTVRLGDCHVYPRMGKRAWAEGKVSDVSAKFMRLEPSTSRIWKMKLFAHLFASLPMILLQRDEKVEIDDGSHRAVAIYLSGIRDVQAYVGTQPQET